MNIKDTDGWDEYRIMVVNELRRLNDNLERTNDKVDDLGRKVAALQVKAGVWGILGGLVPLTIALAMKLLFS